MKIDVNYELMAKIGEAKTGFNVHRVGKKIAILNSFMSLISVMVYPNDIRQIAAHILYSFSLVSFHSIGLEIAGSGRQKREATDELKSLSSRLGALDVSTDDKLLLEAKKYKTDYKINFSDGIIPKIMQNKYVIVPTHNEGEVSLLQEHVIGTKDFALSVGEPEKEKQYKLAYNGI